MKGVRAVKFNEGCIKAPMGFWKFCWGFLGLETPVTALESYSTQGLLLGICFLRLLNSTPAQGYVEIHEAWLCQTNAWELPGTAGLRPETGDAWCRD